MSCRACGRSAPSLVAMATYVAVFALVLAYVVIGIFSAARARQRGVGTRIVPYALTGIIAGLVLTVLSVWPVARHLSTLQSFSSFALLVHGLNPLLGIGLALLVLAWVEGLWALLGFALAYSAFALSIYLYSGARLLRRRAPFGPPPPCAQPPSAPPLFGREARRWPPPAAPPWPAAATLSITSRRTPLN